MPSSRFCSAVVGHAATHAEQALPFKRDMYELGRTYALLCERAGVDIRLNTSVDGVFADEFAPDAVIVAVGSTPIPLPVPADDGARVLSIDDLYLGGAEVGDEVAVIGGGLTGCECALLMAQKGKRAHVIEMRDGLAIDANIRNRPILLEELKAAGVDEVVGAAAQRVSAEGVYVKGPEVERLVPADTVVCAVGQRSRSDAADALRDAAPFVRIVGDAVRPSNITTAVYEAWQAAMDI